MTHILERLFAEGMTLTQEEREYICDLHGLVGSEGKKEKPRKKPYFKPESVKTLERDWYAYKQALHPDNPAVIRTAFRDDTANGLTKCITAYLKMRGHFAARVNTTGVYNAKLKKFIRSGSTLGMADVSAVIGGRSVQFEVKAGKDRPRPEQLEVQKKVRAAGGEYFFTHSFDEFLSQLSTI